MRVAVAGGTGLLGRLVVAELTRAGAEPVVLARSRGVDLTTGAGLDDALTGAGAVVDVSNVTTTSGRTSVRFFTAATSTLLSAADRARVGHVLTLSIVGADTIDVPYYRGKRRQEELLAAGPVPWTLLRATQFHEFPEQLLDRLPRGPLVPVPVMATQPVAAADVAAHLVTLVGQAPAGGTTPMAGPEPWAMTEMVRRVLAARGRRALVVPLRLPGRTGRALAGGGLVPAEPFVRGRTTFAEHLQELAGR
ncbi:SDR family oxidoreductase [Modestobacter excelsi]|uniref:SDR family oxidoreductase n=1 Tax=Modestobacter excelsi TaxID=2213161 RepID=UPI00110C9C3B|nr:SDR family oxidoreductase [Modestobacter excelsi]